MAESIANSDSAPFSWVGPTTNLGSALTELLMAPEIVPGTPPGYQLCKTIYAYHPLGTILADAPITRAQSKPRTISVPLYGEKPIVERYEAVWKNLGKIGGTLLIHDLCSTARRYGIAALGVGEHGKSVEEPLELDKIGEADLFFNILDPLNTAGSLVLNQDPNDPDFMKPSDNIVVAGHRWHPSRLYVKMHERPIYIEWTTSAFGFVGRSVYQRALYPLKSFVQSMVTDQMVVQKSGLLVYKALQPGSLIDSIMQTIMGTKRGAIKAGVTNQVLSIAVDEAIETLNMQNLDKAFSTARMDIIKNIASAAAMPASIIAQETLTEGFGEGTEDANKEIEYLNHVREELDPAYAFLDSICRRQAWTPHFYDTLRVDYDKYEAGGFEAAQYDWIRAFQASWPNLREEPESEKAKNQKVQFEAVVALVEVLAPHLDPSNKANLLQWAADNCNEQEELFASKLNFDIDALEDHLETAEEQEVVEGGEGKEPGKPRPFAAAS